MGFKEFMAATSKPQVLDPAGFSAFQNAGKEVVVDDPSGLSAFQAAGNEQVIDDPIGLSGFQQPTFTRGFAPSGASSLEGVLSGQDASSAVSEAGLELDLVEDAKAVGGGIANIARSAKDSFTDDPTGLEGTYDLVNTVMAARRLEGGSTEVAPGSTIRVPDLEGNMRTVTLTPEHQKNIDQKIIQKFVDEIERQSQLSVTEKIGEGVGQLPAFMATFFLTSPGGAVAKKVVEKGLTKTAQKWLTGELSRKAAVHGVKAAGIGAKGLAQAAQAQNVVAGAVAERRVPGIEKEEDGSFNFTFPEEGLGESFVRGFGSAGIEFISENAGGALLKAIPFRGKLFPVKKLTDIADDVSAGQTFLASVKKHTGIDDIGGEYVEELFGSALEQLIGNRPGAVGDFFDAENQLVTLGTLAVPGAARKVGQKTVELLNKKNITDDQRAELIARIEGSLQEEDLIQQQIASLPELDISEVTQGLGGPNEQGQTQDVSTETVKPEVVAPTELTKKDEIQQVSDELTEKEQKQEIPAVAEGVDQVAPTPVETESVEPAIDKRKPEKKVEPKKEVKVDERKPKVEPKVSTMKKIEDQSGTTAKPEVVKVDKSGLPVGEGKVKASRLANRIVNDLGKVPEELQKEVPMFAQMNKKDQIQKASDYVISNPIEAREAFMGQRALPDGLLHGSVGIALGKQAESEDDTSLLLDLASLRGTRGGQEISILSEANLADPVRYISQLGKRKIEAFKDEKKTAKRRSKIKKEMAPEMRKEIKKAAPQKGDWTAFVESIKC